MLLYKQIAVRAVSVPAEDKLYLKSKKPELSQLGPFYIYGIGNNFTLE